ncbi:MAG TPA: hypothetical protein VG893_14630 [Terracidiphilus sp.]|nr:hypothetical protein [Terracidiphilus sp.]
MGGTTLTPGQEFIFQIRLDKAPEGYEGGNILYEFKNIHGTEAPFQRRVWQKQMQGSVRIQNGESIYTSSLKITEQMESGTWELVDMQIGDNTIIPIKLPDNVIFQIPAPTPVTVSAQFPLTARAGEDVSLTATIEQFPTGLLPGCHIALSAGLVKLPSDSNRVQKISQVDMKSFTVESNQHSYHFSGHIASDMPSGTWIIGVYLSVFGDRPRPDTGLSRTICHLPELRGETKSSITILPAEHLITPTSAVVVINPSQAELLQGAADRLRAKADQIKKRTAESINPANQDFLLEIVKDALKDLDQTEIEFKDMNKEPIAPAVNIFFDDLRAAYEYPTKPYPRDHVQFRNRANRQVPLLISAIASVGDITPEAEAVLISVMHNVSAYELVASTKALTFDLDVYSDPDDASISYRLRTGDFTTVEHNTDWIIQNLPRAVYIIRLKKQGFKEQEVEFDAISSRQTSVHVHLQPLKVSR